jgi:hypothetical protein
VAPKNQPRQKKLNAWVRFGLRHNFDQELLAPENVPALEQDRQLLRAQFIAFISDPEGFNRQFDEIVAELREQFVKANPRLRVRYASVIAPLPATTETEH